MCSSPKAGRLIEDISGCALNSQVSDTLFIDTITGTSGGVGTTIERNLIEAGGFRVIHVDGLEEMYVGSTEFGGERSLYTAVLGTFADATPRAVRACLGPLPAESPI